MQWSWRINVANASLSKGHFENSISKPAHILSTFTSHSTSTLIVVFEVIYSQHRIKTTSLVMYSLTYADNELAFSIPNFNSDNNNLSKTFRRSCKQWLGEGARIFGQTAANFQHRKSQNFNFVHKFSQSRKLPTPNSVLLKKIPNKLKIMRMKKG